MKSFHTRSSKCDYTAGNNLIDRDRNDNDEFRLVKIDNYIVYIYK